MKLFTLEGQVPGHPDSDNSIGANTLSDWFIIRNLGLRKGAGMWTFIGVAYNFVRIKEVVTEEL